MHNHSNGNELHILMQIKLISLTIVEHKTHLETETRGISEMAHLHDPTSILLLTLSCMNKGNDDNDGDNKYSIL